MEEPLLLARAQMARPLELQSAHLSFQEYYAARAICEGANLPKPPWELPVFWANTVRLGLDMGDDFCKGLLRSSGKALQGPSVRVRIRGDRHTSALALGAAVSAASQLQLLK